MRPRTDTQTDRQTDRHTDARDHNTFLVHGLRLTRNVMIYGLAQFLTTLMTFKVIQPFPNLANAIYPTVVEQLTISGMTIFFTARRSVCMALCLSDRPSQVGVLANHATNATRAYRDSSCLPPKFLVKFQWSNTNSAPNTCRAGKLGDFRQTK